MSKQVDKLIPKLEERFSRWNKLKESGGSEPFWADGCNMNLVRNHILYYRRQIKELCDEQGLELPKIYKIEIPEEVDSNYMANVKGIKEKAAQSLEMYKKDENFKEIEGAVDTILDGEARQVAINILYYKKALKTAIKEGDLVAMRRHLDCSFYLKSAEEFVKKINTTSVNPFGVQQLSLFG